MTAQRQFVFWAAGCLVLLLVLFIFKAVLLPFALGMVIAYLLNPAVNALHRCKIARGPAALFILGLFGLAVCALAALAAPLIYREIMDFSNNLPSYIGKFREFIRPASDQLETFLGKTPGPKDMQEMVTDHAGTAMAVAGAVAGKLFKGGQTVLGALGLVVVTPIVAYFMMKEWNRITAWTENMLPRHHKKTIHGLLGQIDRKLSGFIRGQLFVAAVLGAFYAVALSIAGLKYGFLIGLMSGILSVIPLVGSTAGLVVSVIVAWAQTGSWEFPATVAAIFIFGQLVEGNILTPKIVGDRVGLHPLWIFFALMAGGALFGFLGLLLAVPVAAIISVLLGFAIRQYKFSAYFRGPDQSHTDDPNG